MWGQRVACPMRGGSDHTWAGQSAMEKIQKCLDCQIVANLSRKETKSFSLFFFFLPLQCLCHDSELWRGKRAGWRWWQMPGARMLKPRKVLAISCSACSDNRENMYYGRCIDQIFLIVILKWTFIWYDSHFRTANRQRCHLCIFPNKVRSLQKGYLAVSLFGWRPEPGSCSQAAIWTPGWWNRRPEVLPGPGSKWQAQTKHALKPE